MMKKPIHTLLSLLGILIFSLSVEAQCDLISQSTVCPLENISITFSSESTYNNVIVSAFNQIGNTNIPALIQNETETTADVIFLESGNAEIVIQYYQNGDLVDICNQNIIVLGEGPIPSLGMVNDFLGNQVACESIDIDFDILLNCPDCIQTWTINGQNANLPSETFLIQNIQSITTSLAIDSLGEYTLCQIVNNVDSTCYVEDCVQISIMEITTPPIINIVDEEIVYCLGSEINFQNIAEINDEVTYHWTISYDSLVWNYYSEELNFTFDLPGEYMIDLEYTLNGNADCTSPIATSFITISDSPALPISCDGHLCFDDEITYSSPISCSEYEWLVDSEYGTIINHQDSMITVKWLDVPLFAETEVVLLLDGCDENICQELTRTVELFPSEISIEGATNLCEDGEVVYIADYIPDATYTWSIMITDSVSGVSPIIKSSQNNNATIEITSFVGEFQLNIIAKIQDKDCQVSTSQLIRRYNFVHNDNLCKEDLFKAEFFPKIDEDIKWTITKEDGSIFKEEIKSGLSSFLAFGFPEGGTYSISASIPAIDFICDTDKTFEVIKSPEIILLGQQSICTGEQYNYSLGGLGDNDIVLWEIFQNGMFAEITAPEVNIEWQEGAGPYLIRVTRSTEISPGVICESAEKLFELMELDPASLGIFGDEIVCYDALSTYETPIPGIYDWIITPSNMGTIISGDSTESISIQWHYAPGQETASLSYESEICGETIIEELIITFAPFQPIINLPDSVCQDTKVKIEVANLINYDLIEYYINGELIADGKLSHTYTFDIEGWTDINIKILNPNDCPGLVDTTLQIFVKPTQEFDINFSAPLAQCPKETFETINISPSFQDDLSYYTWLLDGVIIKEGYGNPDLYTTMITKIMIENNMALSLTITTPNGCSSIRNISLNYTCDQESMPCECKEDVSAAINNIIVHECNLISFSGTLDFSTVKHAAWIIPQGDSINYIPINNEADLIQDSIYLTDYLTQGRVSMSVQCDGQVILQDETIQDSLCEFIQIDEVFPLFSPRVSSSYLCNEDLLYNMTFQNRNHPIYTSDEYTVQWIINGTNYSGETVEIQNIQPETEIHISQTQCTIDESYCCTKDTIIKSPQPFNPEIILPSGSCENELWQFTINVSPLSIQSILWNFGDGSGSTLVNTEKGFEINDEQTISVIVTNDRGCTAYDTISVETFPNDIEGNIEYTQAPCSSGAPITYIELSDSEITVYEWSQNNAGDTSSITITESGDYSVTVTDSNGCTNVSTFNDAVVNESFSGGIFVKDENCGAATAYISQNDLFLYTWYLNGDSTSTGNSISIFESGQFDIAIVSTEASTNMICDTISKSINIFPNPEPPAVSITRSYCDPLIAELNVTNYPMVTWQGIGINTTSQSFHTSSPGIYSALYTDENGCTSKTTQKINDEKIDFDYLLDLCIQACREDLDSLQIYITGNTMSFEEWSWSSVDSNGLEYTVSSSSGSVPELLITDKMYEYLELSVTSGDCIYTSDRIPLDIIQCTIVEEDEEISCDTINVSSSSCGFDIYECILSEENGGPKFYYEGHISTSTPVDLCRDSLIATLSNGQIDILSYVLETNPDGTLHIDYTANIFIDNVQDFEDIPTYIRFDFCDDLDEEIYCIEYLLPYRTCYIDFDCMIDCVGISYGTDEYVNVNYCLNLSDVVQDGCTLESYYMTLAMTNDFDSKIIYEEEITSNFDQLYCLNIPISIEDFTSGEFECLEMIVEGDCPDILCYDYQCGAFSPSVSAIESKANSRVISTRQSFEIIQKEKSELRVYPNPNRGKMAISYAGNLQNTRYIVKNALGEIIQQGKFKSENQKIDISEQNSGLYFISILVVDEVLVTKKIFLVD